MWDRESLRRFLSEPPRAIPGPIMPVASRTPRSSSACSTTSSRFADMAPLFKVQAGELVVTLPENGIEPAWLARPLAQLGLENAGSFTAVRVEMPASRRWSTPDAAFFARLLAELEAPGRRIEFKGLPPELEKLLALARGARRPVAAPSARRPGIGERIGLAALRGADDASALVALLGEVVLLLPRFVAGRARRCAAPRC